MIPITLGHRTQYFISNQENLYLKSNSDEKVRSESVAVHHVVQVRAPYVPVITINGCSLLAESDAFLKTIMAR